MALTVTRQRPSSIPVVEVVGCGSTMRAALHCGIKETARVLDWDVDLDAGATLLVSVSGLGLGQGERRRVATPTPRPSWPGATILRATTAGARAVWRCSVPATILSRAERRLRRLARR